MSPANTPNCSTPLIKTTKNLFLNLMVIFINLKSQKLSMLSYILLIVGFFLLIKGANYLVEGSSNLARYFKIKPIIIGLTVLALGTSLPELVINLFSSLKGTTDISLGNIIGSNIANILLVLGISTLILKLKIRREIVKKGIPYTLFGVLLLFLLSNDSLFNGRSMLSRIDGMIFILFFLVFLFFIFKLAKREKKLIPKELELPKYKLPMIVLIILGGISFLFLGGKLVIDSVLEIGNQLGVSEFLMSATVLALGTSLPELIVSITAAFKKKVDFLVGNIIGSNVFNIFLILAFSSIINPIPFNIIFNFDIIFLGLITTWLIIFMYTGKKHQLERWNSILFLVLYVFYLTFIFYRG
tara:strand:- start:1183 stop:2250 length:1068 start_codon:yes stop_codon:yes gene_type:complete